MMKKIEPNIGADLARLVRLQPSWITDQVLIWMHSRNTTWVAQGHFDGGAEILSWRLYCERLAIDEETQAKVMNALKDRLQHGRLTAYVESEDGLQPIAHTWFRTARLWYRWRSSGVLEVVFHRGDESRLKAPEATWLWPIPHSEQIPEWAGKEIRAPLYEASDVTQLFPQSPEVEGRQKASEASVSPLSYENDDAPAVNEMHRLIQTGIARSATAAAGMVLHLVPKLGTDESACKRLQRRYAVQFPKNRR